MLSSRHFRWMIFAAGVILLSISQTKAQTPFEKRVNEAIDRGVKHLREIQQPDGRWVYYDGAKRIGATALAGWTLLECDVPPTDNAIQKAAKYVREQSVTETQTYSISLAILFLHKLGDERDIPLIEALAVRLLAGQTSTGGWSYFCPGSTDQARLASYVKDFPEGNVPQMARQENAVIEPRELTPEIAKQVQTLLRRPVSAIPGGMGDNSNSQFAMLALWVAGKYGVPIESAMKQVGERYRRSQIASGSWTYEYTIKATAFDISRSSEAMVCAGLLGFALGHTTKDGAAKSDLYSETEVQKAFYFLAGQMQGNHVMASKNQGKKYYFLWSIERTAVAYDLQRIKGIDWYRWGAEILLANQASNGSWNGEYARGGCDTCFALLFLKRANVTGIIGDYIIIGNTPPRPAQPRPTPNPVNPKQPFPDLGKGLIEGSKEKEKTKQPDNNQKPSDKKPDDTKKTPPKIKLPFGGGQVQSYFPMPALALIALPTDHFNQRRPCQLSWKVAIG